MSTKMGWEIELEINTCKPPSDTDQHFAQIYLVFEHNGNIRFREHYDEISISNADLFEGQSVQNLLIRKVLAYIDAEVAEDKRRRRESGKLDDIELTTSDCKALKDAGE